MKLSAKNLIIVQMLLKIRQLLGNKTQFFREDTLLEDLSIPILQNYILPDFYEYLVPETERMVGFIKI